MSEFEELMGQVDDNSDDIDGEQDEIDGIEGDLDGEQDEIDGMQDQMDEPIDVNVEVEGFNENVDLVPAPKPVTTSSEIYVSSRCKLRSKRNGCTSSRL